MRRLLAIALRGRRCSSGSNTRSTSSSQSETTAPSIGHVSYHTIPEVGRVEVERVPELGLVIVDTKTDADRFFLSTPEAETCLDFLSKRPRYREVIEAVCVFTGRVVRHKRRHK
jgi:hypothetical protein